MVPITQLFIAYVSRCGSGWLDCRHFCCDWGRQTLQVLTSLTNVSPGENIVCFVQIGDALPDGRAPDRLLDSRLTVQSLTWDVVFSPDEVSVSTPCHCSELLACNFCCKFCKCIGCSCVDCLFAHLYCIVINRFLVPGMLNVDLMSHAHTGI